MKFDNCEIVFSGYLPQDQNIDSITHKMRILAFKSPSDARIKLNLVVGETDITGFLSVKSMSGVFESSASGSKATHVFQSLSEQITHQLSHWARNRNFHAS